MRPHYPMNNMDIMERDMHTITFYPVSNADTVLLQAGCSIITDINYRQDAQDDSKSDIYDIGRDIKNALPNRQLDFFINTHPDKDHVSGFADLFHTGEPGDWSKDSDTILVKEIWITAYTEALTNPTEQATPLIDEIKRRKRLAGTEREEDGNRLKVLQAGDQESPSGYLDALILAPNDSESEAEDDDGNRNNSSLVIRWTYSSEGNSYRIMLAGDAEYEVWERLNEENEAEDLSWHLLLSPHHCSRTTYSYKQESGDYEDSDDAWEALANLEGKGFIVTSSKPIKDDEDNPPHYHARNRYIELLDGAHPGGENRFFNPETHGEKDSAKPVVFELNDKGIKIKRGNSTEAPLAIITGAASKPTQYGNEC